MSTPIEQLRADVIQAARAVSENVQSSSYGYVEVEARLAAALDRALDALDKAERAGGS